MAIAYEWITWYSYLIVCVSKQTRLRIWKYSILRKFFGNFEENFLEKSVWLYNETLGPPLTLQGSQHSTDPLICSLLASVSVWLFCIIRFHLQNIYFFMEAIWGKTECFPCQVVLQMDALSGGHLKFKH